MYRHEFKVEAESQSGLAQRMEGTGYAPRVEHPLLKIQRCYGNRFVQRVVALAGQGGGRGTGGQSGQRIYLALGARVSHIQRGGDEQGEQQAPEGGETQVEQPTGETPAQSETQAEPSDFQLTLGDTLGEPEFWRTMQLVPPLVNPLVTGDVSHFSLYLLPTTLGAEMLLASQEEARPPWLEAPPSGAQAPEAAPSVPSSATLGSLGPVQFRVVFEEPSVELPETIRESESRLEEAMAANQPPPGLNTGSLIKGLITAFLTQTPPGQEILQGVTQMVSPPTEEGGEEGGGASVNVNVDLLPTPLMQGEPPMVILGLNVSW